MVGRIDLWLDFAFDHELDNYATTILYEVFIIKNKRYFSLADVAQGKSRVVRLLLGRSSGVFGAG